MASKNYLLNNHKDVDYIRKKKTCISKTLDVSEKEYQRKKKSFLDQNHKTYLESAIRIGFTRSFPEDPNNVIDEIIVNAECMGFDVSFKVRYTVLTFGEKNECSCHGIIADNCKVPREKLWGHGWNSNAFDYEAKVMEKAVVIMAKKHGLMICDKICSWPFAKAIVGKVTDAHVRCHTEKSLA